MVKFDPFDGVYPELSRTGSGQASILDPLSSILDLHCCQSARMPTLRPNDRATIATPKVSNMMKITVMLATSR